MTYLRTTFTLLIAVFILASCQNAENKEESNQDAENTEATTFEEVAEVDDNATSVVLNINIATADELEALISDELVSILTEGRPFISMQEVDMLLADQVDSAAKADLYTKMFVPMNLNTTAEEDFKLIPGVGDRMAHEFEEYRPYVKIEQFRKEIGKYVDEAEVARYEQFVFVPVELNTATKEEILAIPGVGERMLHEFEEYRPYTSMEQFRKEIGKYVDEKELSRLERYVYLK